MKSVPWKFWDSMQFFSMHVCSIQYILSDFSDIFLILSWIFEFVIFVIVPDFYFSILCCLEGKLGLILVQEGGVSVST